MTSHLAQWLARPVGAVCVRPDGMPAFDHPPPAALLPGSFNPLHFGHRALAAAGADRLGSEVHFELSAANVDKPDLTADEVAARVRAFVGVGPVWLTRAATFREKAALFPGVAFVLGFDTAARLIDPKYYRDDADRDAALALLLDRGCRVLVGGRVDGTGAFRTWEHARHALPAAFVPLFEMIPENAFRADVSSTELRKRK